MQINNTLYEKKHHYMIILKELGVLKRQMENEALKGNVSKTRLNEIYEMYNYLFVGLLREGLHFQYIKDASDPRKDIIRLCVDNLNYDCNNYDIKRILKDEYTEILKIPNPEIKNDEEFDLNEKNENIVVENSKNKTPVLPIPNNETNLLSEIQTTIQESVQSVIEKEKTSQAIPKVETKKKKNQVHHKIFQKFYGLITFIVIIVFLVILFTNSTIKNSFSDVKNELYSFISSEEDKKVTNIQTENLVQ